MNNKGQATAEVVLAMLFIVPFALAFAKLFLVMVSVQKMEIASYYAARRWYLESHRNPSYSPKDGAGSCTDPGVCGLNAGGNLCSNILGCVSRYMGCTEGAWIRNCALSVAQYPTMNQVRVKAEIQILPDSYFFPGGFSRRIAVTKNVPFRDRPISYVLPGMQ